MLKPSRLFFGSWWGGFATCQLAGVFGRLLPTTLALLIAIAFSVDCFAQDNQPKKVALLIGVERYEKSGFENLAFAEDDVLELAKELTKNGFAVTTLTGSGSGDLKATSDNIRKVLDELFLPQLAKLKKNDIVFIALAGHGQQKLVEGDEDAFFCPVDAHKSLHTSWISISKLTEDVARMSSSNNNLILIDACRNNPSRSRGVDGKNVNLLKDNMAIFFAAAYGQQAQEVRDFRHGLFTYYVLDGLRGKAKDGDGEVTWDTLVSYVKKKVGVNAEALTGTRQDPNHISNLRGAPPVLSGKIVVSAFAGTRAGQLHPNKNQPIGLVWCPLGKFKMGSPANEPDRGDEEEVDVELTQGFWMGRTEVTQNQWKTVMGTEHWKGEDFVKAGPDYPATYVSHEDAAEFCRELTQRERSAGRLPSGWVYNLPTEAQWEYACRARSDTMYSFGSGASSLKDYAWFGENARDVDEKYAHQVAQKRANAFGLYDMHGNVLEWCRDGWQERLPGGKNPFVEANVGSSRVLRGGSWFLSAKYCRSADRSRVYLTTRGSSYGFRVVLELE